MKLSKIGILSLVVFLGSLFFLLPGSVDSAGCTDSDGHPGVCYEIPSGMPPGYGASLCPSGTSSTGETCLVDANTSGVCCVKPIDCDSINPLTAPVCAFRQLPALAIWLVTAGIWGGALAAIASLIYGGFLYMSARDSTEKRERAVKTITWSAVGLAIAASVFMFFRFIGPALNMDVLGALSIKALAQESTSEGQLNVDVPLVQLYGFVRSDSKQEVMPGTDVNIYWLQDGNWTIWPARSYENQRNPHITDTFGQYQFRVPAGTYYVSVKRDGYFEARSESIIIESSPFKQDLSLERAPTIWIYVLYVGIPLFIGAMMYWVFKKIVLWQKKQMLRAQTLKKIQKHPDDVLSTPQKISGGTEE